jgi:amino acid permease
MEQNKNQLKESTRLSLRKRVEVIETRLKFVIIIILFFAGYLAFFQADNLTSNKFNTKLIAIIIGSLIAVIYTLYTLKKMKNEIKELK